ncbi:hypothetical protein D3C73_558430 [compost metagenome]
MNILPFITVAGTSSCMFFPSTKASVAPIVSFISVVPFNAVTVLSATFQLTVAPNFSNIFFIGTITVSLIIVGLTSKYRYSPFNVTSIGLLSITGCSKRGGFVSSGNVWVAL